MTVPTKKRGRPRITDERERRVVVQIRLSPEEHSVLLQAAARAGLDLSAWIRVVATNAIASKVLELRTTEVMGGPRKQVALSMSPVERAQFKEAATRHKSHLATWLRVVALAAAE